LINQSRCVDQLFYIISHNVFSSVTTFSNRGVVYLP
jgi:hypothetical protein